MVAFKKVEGDKVVCSECVSNGRTKPSVFASSSGNSSLSRHLRVAHRIEKGITNDVQQTTISNQALLVRHNVMSDHDKHAATSALARLIVDAKLSFKLVESPAFREFTRSLNKFFSNYQKAHIRAMHSRRVRCGSSTHTKSYQQHFRPRRAYVRWLVVESVSRLLRCDNTLDYSNI
jgi:hypothetical protein